jgi:hypothetical protein
MPLVAGPGPLVTPTGNSAILSTLPQPYPSNIAGLQTSNLQNFSGIAHNIDKLIAGQNFLFFDAAEPYYQEDWKVGQGGVVTRYLIGPWSQWRQFRSFLLGWSVNIATDGSPPGGMLSRTIPAQHPVEPQLYVTGVDLMRGIGCPILDPTVFVLDQNGNQLQPPVMNSAGTEYIDPVTQQPVANLPMIYYVHNNGDYLTDMGQALLKVTYSHLPYLVKDDATIATDPNMEAGRNVTWEYGPNIQAIQVPPAANGQLRFINSPVVPASLQGTIIPGNPTLLLPTAEIVATWWDVPDIPFDTIQRCVGKINPNDFPPAANPLFGPPKPSGTLLCNSPKFENYRAPLGYWTRKVRFSFMYRDTGWNSFPAADGSGNFGFYPATFNGVPGGNGIYKPGQDSSGNFVDFIKMFQVPAPSPYQ